MPSVVDPHVRPDADTRLAELILYVARRCERHTAFGAVKLNKILFYADFIAFAKLGEPITGTEYFRLPMGPAPRRLEPVTRTLFDHGDAVEQSRAVFAKMQKRIVPLREANLDLFTAAQIAIVDEVIDALCSMTADEVTELSHQFAGWELAEDHETIPYASALIPSTDWQPDAETVRAGNELAAKL